MREISLCHPLTVWLHACVCFSFLTMARHIRFSNHDATLMDTEEIDAVISTYTSQLTCLNPFVHDYYHLMTRKSRGDPVELPGDSFPASCRPVALNRAPAAVAAPRQALQLHPSEASSEKQAREAKWSQRYFSLSSPIFVFHYHCTPPRKADNIMHAHKPRAAMIFCREVS